MNSDDQVFAWFLAIACIALFIFETWAAVHTMKKRYYAIALAFATSAVFLGFAIVSAVEKLL